MSTGDTGNPTPLRIGAGGLLDGRRYTVRGRVVLSAEIDGETWYWNEFNLVDASGGAVTLVHEEVEEGSPWKLFQRFEPLRPISAADAAAKRVGDTIDFGGRHARVTLVDQTRVRHIEGEAPEGVEVGDVADYFNAEVSGEMIVVSWTGDEVECFEGRPIAAHRVEQEFGLPSNPTAPGGATASFSSTIGNWTSGSNRAVLTGAIIAVVALVNSIGSCGRGGRPAEPPAKVAAPAAFLAPGAAGTLAAGSYTITAHALVEIARPGGKFDRHEYELAAPAGTPALLVNSLGGGPGEWHLLLPADVPAGLTPPDAAALRQGRVASLGGRPVQVTQVFRATTLRVDGPAAQLWPAGVHYGLLGRTKDTWLIARWTETELRIFEGRPVPESEVRRAFPAPR